MSDKARILVVEDSATQAAKVEIILESEGFEVDVARDGERGVAMFAGAVPPDLVDRVFVIGASQTPEDLRTALQRSYEQIGRDLAEECFTNTQVLWGHAQLLHNAPDCQRMP